MRGIYSAILRMLTIEFLIKRGAGLFAQYFQGAAASAKIVGPKKGEVYFGGCFGFDRNVWLDQAGSVERLLTLAGAKKSFAELSQQNDAEGTGVIVCSWE